MEGKPGVRGKEGGRVSSPVPASDPGQGVSAAPQLPDGGQNREWTSIVGTRTEEGPPDHSIPPSPAATHTQASKMQPDRPLPGTGTAQQKTSGMAWYSELPRQNGAEKLCWFLRSQVHKAMLR